LEEHIRHHHHRHNPSTTGVAADSSGGEKRSADQEEVGQQQQQQQQQGAGLAVGYLMSPCFKSAVAGSSPEKKHYQRESNSKMRKRGNHGSESNLKRPGTAYERFAGLQFRLAALLAEEEALLSQVGL
jgi:hypothetical protein